MNRPRIAHVAGFPPHVLPGLEHLRPRTHYATWLPQLALTWAAQEKFDFHWIVCNPKTAGHAPITWMGQAFHFINVPTRFSTMSGFWFDSLRIKSLLDALDPAIVHGWGTEDPSGYAAARSGRKWILSVQGILSEYVASARMPRILRLRAMLERRLLARAQWITVESKWGEAIIRQMAPQARISRIEYGVNPLFYEVSWTPDPQRPVAAFVGTTDYRKGIHDVVQAFRDQRLRNAELWIFGDDDSPLARKLRPTSSANVKWMGRRPVSELAQELRKSWCLVLPTRADTSPNVVKESRVIGLPVITTNCGGQSDYIEDSKNGYIVAPADHEGLVRRLSALLGDIQLAKELGAYIHEDQREHFRPEHTGRALISLYERVMGEPATR